MNDKLLIVSNSIETFLEDESLNTGATLRSTEVHNINNDSNVMKNTYNETENYK